MKIRCAYEDEEFDSEAFDSSGEHLEIEPRHLLTGELITDAPGGTGPMEVADPDPDQ